MTYNHQDAFERDNREQDLRNAWYVSGSATDLNSSFEAEEEGKLSAQQWSPRYESSGKFGAESRKKKTGINFSALRKPILWYLFIFVATAGFVSQLLDITTLFFKYATVTELIVDVPTNVTAPALSLCFPYDELANRSLLYNKIPELTGKKNIKLGDVSNILTIKDMFDMTPLARELVEYCMYRKPRSYVRHLSRQNEKCQQVFEVSKYYKQQYICYQFNLLTDKDDHFTFDYIQNSLLSPGMFYELAFGKEAFANVDSIQAIVHAPDVKPRGNKAFPVAFSRISSTITINGQNLTLRDDYFFLSYSMFVNNLLPKPYATDCLDYNTVEYESQEHCIDVCVTQDVVALKDKMPFTAVSIEPVNMRHVSVEDNLDEAFAKAIADVRKKCNEQCYQPNCRDEVYVTKFIRSESFELLSFRLYIANEPTLVSTFKPKLSWTEYLVYALSCFGIWFGLSFFSFMEVAKAAEDWIKSRRERYEPYEFDN